MPSPTIATTWPSACSRWISCALSSGSTSASTRVDADLRAAIAAAVAAVVAGEHDDRRAPSGAARVTAAAASGLTASATAMSPSGAPVDRHEHDRLALGRQRLARAAPGRRRRSHEPSMSAAVAEQTARPSDASASTPWPGTAANEPTGGNARPRSLAAAYDRLAERMLGALLDRGGQARARRPRRVAADRDDVGHARAPVGQRAGLVEHHGVDAAQRSSASALRISTPCSAPRPVATMIAVGVASPRRTGRR